MYLYIYEKLKKKKNRSFELNVDHSIAIYYKKIALRFFENKLNKHQKILSIGMIRNFSTF